MPFVKLDTGMLDSSLWIAPVERDVFLTALMMAVPFELPAPAEQLDVRTMTPTGFVVPAGWYGLVPAAGPGIVRRAIVDQEAGLAALEHLGAPDGESRSGAFEGRRLVRIDGGYLVLNYMAYRERDYTAAERAKRYRDTKKAKPARPRTKPSHRDDVASHRNVTQADADAEADAEAKAGSNTPQGEVAREDAPPQQPARSLTLTGTETATAEDAFGVMARSEVWAWFLRYYGGAGGTRKADVTRQLEALTDLGVTWKGGTLRASADRIAAKCQEMIGGIPVREPDAAIAILLTKLADTSDGSPPGAAEGATTKAEELAHAARLPASGSKPVAVESIVRTLQQRAEVA